MELSKQVEGNLQSGTYMLAMSRMNHFVMFFLMYINAVINKSKGKIDN